jgi:ribokinase
VADIIVVGSLNMDIVTRVHRFPAPGETLQASKTQFSPGGKGANQAVAAARMGASVVMAGGVGNDSFGVELKETLATSSVDIRGILQQSDTTGIADITVDENGQNTILISGGANMAYSWEEASSVLKQLHLFDGCKIALFQNEIAMQTNEDAIRDLAKRGVRIFYNPAPAIPVGNHCDVFSLIDILILNEHEAEVLTGVKVEDDSSAGYAARKLLTLGVGSVILTLGSKGLFYLDKGGMEIEMPAFPVKVVDTTAAGDTFIGSFAAAISAGKPVGEALQIGSAAAALSVMKPGAQVSIPTRADVDSFLTGFQQD